MDVDLVGKTLPDEGNDGHEYIIQEQIGTASSANVYKAIHVVNSHPTEFVSLKVLRMANLEEWKILDAETLRSIEDSDNSVNIVGMKTTFMSRHVYRFACVSMDYMSEGSLRYITGELFKNGWPEDCIAIALRETLKGVSFLHGLGYIHKKIDAGQIFVHWDAENDEDVAIKLAFEATIYEHKHNNQENISAPLRNICSFEASFVPTSDIWAIGITAMELASGCFPVKNRLGFQAVISEIIKKKKVPAAMVGRQFMPEFEEVVVKCLTREHEMRPTADQLLQLAFFQRSKDLRFFQEAVVNAKKGRK